MTTWKLTIEYDGTRYSGWQDQKNARTVQGELRKALDKVLAMPLELHGAGRTDAGVHAAAQVAHLRVRGQMRRSTEQLLQQVNDALPADISVLEWQNAPSDFHARHDALTRSYVYQIAIRKTAFSKKYVWWIKDPLNIELMEKAVSLLPGRHDFHCFRAVDPSKPDESTIVVVEEAELEQRDSLVLFRIEASHFLWRMVRRIAGVLVKVGREEISLDDFEELLAARCRPELDVAAWTAPSSGLFLEGIRYPDSEPVQKKKKR